MMTLRGQILVSTLDADTALPSVCPFKTSPCMPVHHASHVEMHVRNVLLSSTGMCCGCTHGGFHCATPHPIHTAQHSLTHTTQHSITYNITWRNRERERDRERKQIQRETERDRERRQEKTRQEKTRQDETRRDETRHDKTSQDGSHHGREIKMKSNEKQIQNIFKTLKSARLE